MKINIPADVEKIINTLEEAGYEAYAVGGCVRDSILGKTPNDWDITTSAKPMETKALFKKTFDTGIKHGTVSVLLNHVIYEVTTYRIDGEYEDSRHPRNVLFTDRLSEDLMRRDFTINAMAYNPKRGLVDLYDGQKDINEGVIRCVGDPYERFNEDALRMLRAVRFSAQLGYEIEEKTGKAIKDLSVNLKKISAERIREELVKTIMSDNPGYIRKAYELGITEVILPEFDLCMETEQHCPHHCYTVGEHTIRVMENVKAEKVLRLAALMHDMGKPVTRVTDDNGDDHFKGHPLESARIASDIMGRLKFDNDTRDRVIRLVKNHDWTINNNGKHIRRDINRIGEEAFPDIFDLNRADILAQSKYKFDEKAAFLETLRAEYEEVIRLKQCVSLKTLAVSGKDLIERGIKPGPELGAILNRLLDKVLEDPSLNDREALLKMIDE